MILKIRLILVLMVFLVACFGKVDSRTRYKPIENLEALPPVDIVWAPELEYSLQYFLKKDPQYLIKARKSFYQYEEDLTNIFYSYRIPLELLNVAAIESKFDPKARSKYGAVGMWQFMPTTAKAYNLKVTYWNDQRKDPILSTEAAARYLYDLYVRFQDWHWALAAYNAGPTRVAKVYHRSSTKNFWDSTHLLPGQTKAFVSRIMAAIIIERNQIQFKSYNKTSIAMLVQMLREIYV